MTETQIKATERLPNLEKDLELLLKKEYVAPVTPTEYEANGTVTEKDAEYEIDNAFSDPLKAVGIFVEIGQTKREIRGLKRLTIIDTTLGEIIKERTSKSRALRFNPPLINGHSQSVK